MAKPRPVRIPSDDCLMTIDGTAYDVHAGEWVEMVPGVTAADMHAIAVIQRSGSEIAALDGDSERLADLTGLLDEHFAHICESLASRITAWTWTDDAGEPLPSPFRDPAVIATLRVEELTYLMNLSGESGSDRGKGSNGSPTTSSDTKLTPLRERSSTPASRTRAS